MENNKNIEVENQEVENKKKISVSGIITAIIIILIIAAFAGIAYYNKAIVPDKKIDKAIGYKPEDYITAGKLEGFEYEITQEMFDEYVSEFNTYYMTTDRAAQTTDEVDFNYTGFVNGQKDKNISGKDAVLTIGEDIEGIYKYFADAIVGLKEGETAEVTVSGEEASVMSENGTKYTDDVVFKLEVTSVSELVVEEMSDEWVVENWQEEYGFESLADLYASIEESLETDALSFVWDQAVQAAVMSGWPDSLYEEIYIEFIQNANYEAEFWGMEGMDYLYTVCGYTDETLEEAYIAEVKAELFMWYLVKKWDIEATEEEVEEQYELYAEELEYDTVDEMKEVYTYAEMEEVVLLEKVQQHILDNSTIKKSYTLPTN